VDDVRLVARRDVRRQEPRLGEQTRSAFGIEIDLDVAWKYRKMGEPFFE